MWEGREFLSTNPLANVSGADLMVYTAPASSRNPVWLEKTHIFSCLSLTMPVGTPWAALQFFSPGSLCVNSTALEWGGRGLIKDKEK